MKAVVGQYNMPVTDISKSVRIQLVKGAKNKYLLNIPSLCKDTSVIPYWIAGILMATELAHKLNGEIKKDG